MSTRKARLIPRLSAAGAALAIGGAVLIPASPASAASRDGVCQSGEFCYYFNSNNAGSEIFISYNYATGFFAFGYVKWASGANAGTTQDVRTFAPGLVTLALPAPYPIQPGDAYTIVAGCDKQIGTCVSRYDNVLNFRGEAYIPGPDVLLSPQS